MVNNITVSWKVWKDRYTKFKSYKNANKKEPAYVTITGNEVQLKDWKDSISRVKEFKKANGKNPSTVRLTIPSTIKTLESSNNGVIPVFHFNQQNVGKGFAEYSCGPVSSLICASAYDLVNRDNFMAKTYGLIEAMKTRIVSGTHPDDLVSGFNKYFTSLKMEKQTFNEANIKDNIKNNIPMVINLLTNSNFGYKGKYGYYMAITGYKDGKVGISDLHGFSIGKGTRYWHDYKVVKQALDNNGSRPLFKVIKK